MTDSNTACALPWIHVASKVDGQTRPCCIAAFSKSYSTAAKQILPGPSIYTNTFEKILFSDYLSDIRRKMDSGIEPDDCKICYQTEKRGTKSKRQQENEKWYPVSKEPIVRYLDLRFNNACNLRCVMCSAKESSSWKSEAKTFSSIAKNVSLKEYFSLSLDEVERTDFALFLDEFKKSLTYLEEVYFAGGEPLLQKEHEICIEAMIDSGLSSKISLSYNTNGTILNQRILELWSKFKHVQVNVSIDAVESRNEYIRYPSSWRNIVRNLRTLDESASNISIRITTTVSALNISYLDELIQWKIEQKFKKIQTQLAPGDLDLNIVYFPQHLNAQIFSTEYKNKIGSSFVPLINSNLISENVKQRLIGLTKFLHEYQIDVEVGYSAFIEYLNLIDRHRSLNSRNIFPTVWSL